MESGQKKVMTLGDLNELDKNRGYDSVYDKDIETLILSEGDMSDDDKVGKLNAAILSAPDSQEIIRACQEYIHNFNEGKHGQTQYKFLNRIITKNADQEAAIKVLNGETCLVIYVQTKTLEKYLKHP